MQSLLHLTAALTLHYTVTARLTTHTHPLYITLFIAITVLEGIRMSSRILAHTMLDSTKIIPLEFTLTMAYFAFIWTGRLFFGMPLNVQTIFIPFFFSSLIATSLLVNAIPIANYITQT